MKLEHWLREDGRTTYLLGDEGTGIGIVFDPPRQPAALLEAADRLGLTIGHVFFTEDLDRFLPSLLPFRESGAHLYCCARSIPRFGATALNPGCAITIGRIQVRSEERPGRRVAFHLYELGPHDQAVQVLDVLARLPEPAVACGEIDGYPRSLFLQSFSRW
jgi:hypothetical protein